MSYCHDPRPSGPPNCCRLAEEKSLSLNRDYLLEKVEEAATRSFEWGIELAGLLVDSANWDSDLWTHLIHAWSRELDEDKHGRVLSVLSQSALYKKHGLSIADALRALVRNGGLPYATKLSGKANNLALALWSEIDPNALLEQPRDWLFEAHHHPAGVLTLYWLESCSLSLRHRTTDSGSIPDEYRSPLMSIIQGDTPASVLSKVVLSSQSRFLVAVDEIWSTQNLIPLLEEIGSSDSQAVWHGFVNSSLSPPLASKMKRPFINAISSMDQLFPAGGGARRQFIGALRRKWSHTMQIVRSTRGSPSFSELGLRGEGRICKRNRADS